MTDHTMIELTDDLGEGGGGCELIDDEEFRGQHRRVIASWGLFLRSIA